MKESIKKDLNGSSPLFAGYSPEETESIIAPLGSFRKYDPGEVVLMCGKDGETASLCVVLSGRVVIRSCDSKRSILLRFASAGSEVGAAGLFSSTPIETSVTACGDGPTEIFLISRDSVLTLIDKSFGARFRDNLFRLLSDKVRFLNERISCVTGGSAERRLAFFLNSCRVSDDGTVDPGMSMTALAYSLDIGRASLYRAFDSLSSEGIIRRDGDKIIVTDKEKLEKIVY